MTDYVAIPQCLRCGGCHTNGDTCLRDVGAMPPASTACDMQGCDQFATHWLGVCEKHLAEFRAWQRAKSPAADRDTR